MKKIFLVLFALSWLSSCRNDILAEQGVLGKCQITNVEDHTSSGGPGRSRTPFYIVTYILNNDSTHSKYKVDCSADFMYSGSECDRYKDKNFDVIYLPGGDMSTNQILLAPEDYEHFHKELPDSMAWIINYIKGWKRTSHGMLNY